METTILKTWKLDGRTINKTRDEDGDVVFEVLDADGACDDTCSTLAEARESARELNNADMVERIYETMGDMLRDADVPAEALGRKLKAILAHLAK